MYDTITLDVQHNFHFGLDLIADSGQDYANTRLHVFAHTLCQSIVYVLHIFNFDLYFFADSGQSQKYLVVCMPSV